jgi:RecJ-like exonuclease
LGDLADLAIVGAVGDLQARKFGKLVGCNREILKQGAGRGVLDYRKGLSFFGKQTREVFKLLMYSSDPYLPGLTGNDGASIEFLRKKKSSRRWSHRWFSTVSQSGCRPIRSTGW